MEEWEKAGYELIRVLQKENYSNRIKHMKSFSELFTPIPATYLVKNDLLRKWRKERGLKQKELAKLVGYSCAFICDIEKGRRTVSQRLADKIWKVIKSQAAKGGK